ncbi:hypothetical protein L1049_023018 [Liquidambar formosana]|uniref:Uncharacterized protein n=1 Tax=Liquidambar formosana TaxID=63359 RepID=A0AAP0RDC0_LIQFO
MAVGKFSLLLAEYWQSYELELEKNISRIGDLFKRLRLRRPKLEPFFNQLFLANHTNAIVEEPSETSMLASGAPHDKDGSNIKAKEISDSDKGKMKASQPTASGNRSNKNNRETEGSKGKGNNSKNMKGKKGKGNRKK